MVIDSIRAENLRPGTPRTVWDLPAGQFGGVAELQGFVDGFSINRTQTAQIKVGQIGQRGWKADIYRLGWYQGHGARLITTIKPTAAQMRTGRTQPTPKDISRGSVDCSSWAPVLTWKCPPTVPGGMFLARLTRTDGAASHILFVVRDDARRPDIRIQLADPTWQAYNAFGGLGAALYDGNSFYRGTRVDQYADDCAQVVSYNRPIINRGACDPGRSYGAVRWSNFFTGEYPAVRWLERMGYDVAYMAGLDAAGSLPINAKVAAMLGHNEYWPPNAKNVWIAHLAGGNHMFNTASNEAFWRVLGEANDSHRRPRRLRCHKELIPGRQSPPGGWTGTWRAMGEPENQWTGTIYAVNGPTLRSLIVPPEYTGHRLWRGCGLSTVGGWTSPPQILGFEIDTYGPAGTSAAGAAQWMATPGPAVTYASDTEISVGAGTLLTDAGQEYAYGGTARHRLVYVQRAGGGITFSTGSMNWVLGLDDANVANGVGDDNTSDVIRRATMNALEDMGVTPRG